MSIQFSKNELESKGIYPTAGLNYGYEFFPTEILSTPVTPKENFLAYLNREPACWIPDQANETNYVMPSMIADNIAQGPNGGIDTFGVVWVPDTSCPDLPAFIKPGFKLCGDIENWKEDIPWPDVDSWDWEAIRKEYSVLSHDRASVGSLQAGLFERMTMIFTFEDAAAYLLTEPELVHEFLDKLTDYNISVIKHLKEYCDIDIVFFHDDWGAQRSPLFSPDVVKEFFVPCFKRMTNCAHELGLKFIHHSCGRNYTLVPLMIECGSDVWNLQIEANEDELMHVIEEYGDKILFDIYYGCGKPLPENDEECKKFIIEKYETFGKTGRCSIGFMDSCENRGFDLRRFAYEQARKICQ